MCDLVPYCTSLMQVEAILPAATKFSVVMELVKEAADLLPPSQQLAILVQLLDASF